MTKEKVVDGYKFALIYVDELAPNQAFYETYLGFGKTAEYGPGEIFGKIGDVEVWIGENYTLSENDEKSTHATVMFGVVSAGNLFKKLKADNVAIIQEEPIFMGKYYWLQFKDPADNIVEVLGGE